MSRSLICICNGVTEMEILKMLKMGALSTAELQRTTQAGTSCGRCLATMDRMVEEFRKAQPDDLQQRINFD